MLIWLSLQLEKMLQMDKVQAPHPILLPILPTIPKHNQLVEHQHRAALKTGRIVSPGVDKLKVNVPTVETMDRFGFQMVHFRTRVFLVGVIVPRTRMDVQHLVPVTTRTNGGGNVWSACPRSPNAPMTLNAALANARIMASARLRLKCSFQYK